MKRYNLGYLFLIMCFTAASAWAQTEGYPQSDQDAQILRERAQEKWDRGHGVSPATIPAAPTPIEPFPVSHEENAPEAPASATPEKKTKSHVKKSRHHTHRKTAHSHKATRHKRVKQKHTDDDSG